MKNIVILRPLCEKDAIRMLEWMLDLKVTKNLRFDNSNLNIEDAFQFIRDANKKEPDMIHRAITDKSDNYMGTISLKNIDIRSKCAEYAISMRSDSQGKGYAYQATKLILKMAFEELKLNRVYLNVLSENKRAIQLYEKSGFIYEGEFREHIFVKGKVKSLCWYGMLRSDYINIK